MRIEWRNHLEERYRWLFSLLRSAHPIPSHAEAESRAHALAACSLRKVAPGGLWLRASRRCTWRRTSAEIGSGCDEKKGPVARNTRRELDAKARCQQATAVGGERREAGGESRAVGQGGSSAPVQTLPCCRPMAMRVCRCVSVVGRCCERWTARLCLWRRLDRISDKYIGSAGPWTVPSSCESRGEDGRMDHRRSDLNEELERQYGVCNRLTTGGAYDVFGRY